ncbi:hypothetical protein [Lederbergia citrea]|uniref:Uncharacterized protein n=1 Tax=Lederbergia citrea TaxID=2833581 RepID=A0A942UR92_9BACI|nr:hypothetical protein [Lederbergia citrea]MBS4223343.1 hypothetical protein [Lederbergia citrea]
MSGKVVRVDSIVDVDIFWVNHKGVSIEILCMIFKTHTQVTANYFLPDEEEISGVGIERIGILGVKASLKKAQKLALEDLDRVLDEQSLKIWSSKRPNTNEPVMFEFFGPKKGRKK